MSESLCIDSPLRGLAMPKAYSGDLRERVIEAVETGASRREAAERFEISVASAVKWLQRWCKAKSAAPKPRGGSISPLEKVAARVCRAAPRRNRVAAGIAAQRVRHRPRNRTGRVRAQAMAKPDTLIVDGHAFSWQRFVNCAASSS
jgi:hypothetical protein